MKTIPRLVWVAPVILLMVATARFPYAYYTFTRIVTCGTAVWIALVGCEEGPAIKAWSIVLLLIAVLFNPIIPVHLHRSTWFYLDLGAAGVFVAHLFFVRQRLS
jgi:hypothetical protein